MIKVYSGELWHYGILGMKWGVRRYQNPDGTLTSAGRRRYGTAENLASGRTKKQAEKYNKEKEEAIRSGDPKKITRFSKDMTDEEMMTALHRIRTEQALSELQLKDIQIGHDRVKRILGTVGDLATAAESVTRVYNATAKTLNAFNKDDDKKLPIIGENNKKKIGDRMLEYKFQNEKTTSERNKWFQDKLRNNSLEYFREHANEFSTEELEAVKKRFNSLKDL